MNKQEKQLPINELNFKAYICLQLQGYVFDTIDRDLTKDTVLNSLDYLFEYMALDTSQTSAPKNKIVTKMLAQIGITQKLLIAFSKNEAYRNINKSETESVIYDVPISSPFTINITSIVNSSMQKALTQPINPLYETDDAMIAHLVTTNGSIANNVLKALLEKKDYTELMHNLRNDVLKANNKKSRLNLKETPELTSMGKEMRKIKPLLIGREKEMEELIDALMTYGSPNAILLGSPGVGKTALIERLAYLMATNKIDFALQNNDIIKWDLTMHSTDTQHVGTVQNKFMKVLKAIQNRPDIFLFMDEIHNIAGAGKNSKSDFGVAEMLKPHLTSGKLRMIGATTKEEYTRDFADSRAFTRRFNTIEIPEPTPEQTVEILKGIKARREKFYGLKIPNTEIERIVERCTADKAEFSPSKELKALDKACVRAKRSYEKTSGVPSTMKTVQLSQKEVDNVFSK